MAIGGTIEVFLPILTGVVGLFCGMVFSMLREILMVRVVTIREISSKYYLERLSVYEELYGLLRSLEREGFGDAQHVVREASLLCATKFGHVHPEINAAIERKGSMTGAAEERMENVYREVRERLEREMSDIRLWIEEANRR